MEESRYDIFYNLPQWQKKAKMRHGPRKREPRIHLN